MQVGLSSVERVSIGKETKSKLLVHRLHPSARLPRRGTGGSAGLDMVSVEAVTIAPGARARVPTGLAMAIPDGCYGRIAPRSGLALRFGLHVLGGVIDPDFRGEVKVVMTNLGLEPVTLATGDRIAQRERMRRAAGRWPAEGLARWQRGSLAPDA